MDLKGFSEYLAQAGRSPHTLAAYLRDVKRFLGWWGRGPTLVERKDLDNYLKLLQAQEKPELMACTIRCRFAAISSYYRFLFYTKAIKAIPVAGLMLPASGKRETIPLTRKDIEALRQLPAATFQEKLDQLVWELFYATGGRLSELASPMLQAYDPAKRTIVVTAKGNKQLTKRLTVRAQGLLSAYLASLPKDLPRERKLLAKEDGSPYLRYEIYRSVKRVAAKALPGKRVYPHLLRHTAITHRWEVGEDLKALQVFAGHASIATTGHYTHLSDEKETELMDRFDPDCSPPEKKTLDSGRAGGV